MKRLLFALLLSSLATAFAETRTWMSKEGVEIEASYVSHAEGMVTLRLASNFSEHRFPIADFSEADRQWIAAREGGPEAAAAPAAGEGIYIAAGNGLHRMSSNDGRVWSNHEFVEKPGHNQNDLKAIAVGNGACVVVGGFSRSNILTTTDGVEWHKNDFNIGVLSGVVFTEGRFHAFGEGGNVGVSKDGIAWEKAGSGDLRGYLTQEAEELGEEKPIKSNIRAWRHVDGVFVGSGDNSIIATTRDFEDWNFQRLEPRSRLYIESDANGFVVRGERSLHHSPDGMSWTEVTPELDEKAKLFSITHDGERFLVNSRDGRGWESADGREWAEIDGATFPNKITALRPDLIYSHQIYWKYTEDLKVSTDGGESWESCDIPAPAGVVRMIFAEGLPKF